MHCTHHWGAAGARGARWCTVRGWPTAPRAGATSTQTVGGEETNFEFAAKIECKFRHDYLVGRVGSGGGGGGCCSGRDGGGGGGGAVAEAGDVDVPAGDLLAVLVPDGRVAVGEIHCKEKERRNWLIS